MKKPAVPNIEEQTTETILQRVKKLRVYGNMSQLDTSG